MNSGSSRVTVHTASSLDLFVSSTDGSVSWMETTDVYEQGAEAVTAQGVEEFLNTLDCDVLGSKTYELALSLG